ncbi:hypothetical protein [Methylobacterium sp.]|uniref:hypothetical protein n=1 Tax=Methylobacterium sp. TaxID=409 RepID=UPI003B5AD56E
MFNNPFDSFHDTVAEAKDEREQLDRLLTISTPRERQLVAAIGVLLCIVAAWLFLGDVARGISVDGVLVEPGEDTLEGHRSVQALVWVGSDVAPHIEVGMPAAMELAMTDGEAGTLDGEIATISAVPLAVSLSEVPVEFESAAPVSVYRVDVALEENLDSASLAGKKCRIVIELGRQSPIEFFRMRLQ